VKRQHEVVDKSAWGDGPWNTEPDRAEWKHAGLPCLAVRHPRSGHWCGYAAVPPGHPEHGHDYDTPNVDVHGGLTYAKACEGDVCHVPKPGEPDDVWWFGFDCAHAGDFSPYENTMPRRYPWSTTAYSHERAMAAVDDWDVEKYRTLDYVCEETNRLAEQLSKTK
jgi:hypothetical protein